MFFQKKFMNGCDNTLFQIPGLQTRKIKFRVSIPMKQNPEFDFPGLQTQIPGFVSITYPETVTCQNPKFGFQVFDECPILTLLTNVFSY